MLNIDKGQWFFLERPPLAGNFMGMNKSEFLNVFCVSDFLLTFLLLFYLEDADEEIQHFIESFYPEQEFREFLKHRPDIFIIFEDDTVSLIEKEAVEYFEECMKYGRQGWYYLNLRGCIGQAPAHVIKYINEYFPAENFWYFLECNSKTFHIKDEYVYLREKEA